MKKVLKKHLPLLVILWILFSTTAWLAHQKLSAVNYSKTSNLVTSKFLWRAGISMCNNCANPLDLNYPYYGKSEFEIDRNKFLAQLPDRAYQYEGLTNRVNEKYGSFSVKVTTEGKNLLTTLDKKTFHIGGVGFEPLPEIQRSAWSEWQIRSCSFDGECISVGAGTCGCSAGGTNTAIAIYYADFWQERRSANFGAMCPLILSDDPSCTASPVCDAGQCKLK